MQYVLRGNLKSSIAHPVCGVPLVSVLGPLLFILFTADLVHLMECFSLPATLYADDIQVYGSYQPSELHRLSSFVTNCIGAVSDWMKLNRLQLIPDKTDVLWRATGQRKHQFGGVDIKPAASIRNLDVFCTLTR
jgi:Reverse transcriptase (RNA-dependent DNA polymerase)